MRNTNKKGFTIVELVVVVAVIAILAAVMIPVFSGIIDRANESADIHAGAVAPFFVRIFKREPFIKKRSK